MKQIKYRDLLRKPKGMFPIPPEGIEVVRQQGNFVVYPSDRNKKIADIKMSDKFKKINK